MIVHERHAWGQWEESARHHPLPNGNDTSLPGKEEVSLLLDYDSGVCVGSDDRRRAVNFVCMRRHLLVKEV